MSSVKPGTVLFVKSPQVMVRFYRALTGMKVVHTDKDIIVLESAGWQLMLHPVPPRIARDIEITEPPQRRTMAAAKMVFPVDSIAEVRALAPQFGGELNPPDKMFKARGFRACDGHDPEGNVIQFREDANAAARPAKKRTVTPITFDTVRNLALSLPQVSDTSTLRGIAFKAYGRLLACKAINRSAEPDTLMVRVGEAERDRLIAAEPEVYYLTSHYLVNASVLVRLPHISRKGLEAVLNAGLKFVSAEKAAKRSS